MVKKFKRLIWLWIQCAKSMRNITTFVPFLIYALFQIVLLYSLNNFSRSPFSNILVPIIRQFFGEAALHYPNYYMIVSPLYSQMNIFLSGFLGIVLVGMATQVFISNFRNDVSNLGDAFKTTMSKYLALFVTWVIVSALTLLMIIGVPHVLNNFLNPPYFLGRLFDLFGLFFGIVVASIFAYTTVLIVVERVKVLQAISKTLSIFIKNVGTSFFLIGVPTAFYFPISYISRRIDLVIAKYSPETILVVLGIGIFITLISSYFQVGSVTRFYLLLNESKGY